MANAGGQIAIIKTIPFVVWMAGKVFLSIFKHQRVQKLFDKRFDLPSIIFTCFTFHVLLSCSLPGTIEEGTFKLTLHRQTQ